MDDIKGELAGIHEHLHRHDLRFDKLETEVSQMGAKLGLQLEQLQSTVQFLAEQISSFIHSNTDLRHRVDSLEEKQSMTDLRLRVLEQRS